MVEDRGKKDEVTNNVEDYDETRNPIKDYKTAISYLEELLKLSLTMSYTELLDFTSRSNVCVECVTFRTNNQKIITVFFQKI